MRISTSIIYSQSVSSMHRQQNLFMKVGEQIASGRRVVTPSDDPQAASRAVGVSQAKAITEQYTDARVGARNALAQEESVLNSVGDAITRAKTLLVQASSDSLSISDRASVASELKGVFETILGQANATDGNGRHLFGGYRDDSAPFVKDNSGVVTYVGDTNVREQRVDASRLMSVTDHGEAIFKTVPSGTGYLARANENNAGNLTFVGPRTVDSAHAIHGNAFKVSFAQVGADMTYSVDGGAALVYTPGQSISYAGVSLTLKGNPADGDSIDVAPAALMEPDLFATLQRAITALETPVRTDTEKAALRNTLSSSMRELDNGLDNVLTVRASVGARLNELDTVDSVADRRILNYEKTLSDLVDLDYVEAISEYSRRQIGLEAAQKTFAQLSGLTLFSKI